MFVTFEGIEGSGKSTLMQAVAGHLAGGEAPVRVTREPGGTPLGERVRELFLHADAPIAPLAEAFLMSAARAQHVAAVIAPALARGEMVLCDRFFDATVAYQGFGRGLDIDMLLVLAQTATGGLVPDVTLLLDIPVELSRVRVEQRNRAAGAEQDRLEQEDAGFHERVRAGYLELAKRFARFTVLDASLPPAELLETALHELTVRLQ